MVIRILKFAMTFIMKMNQMLLNTEYKKDIFLKIINIDNVNINNNIQKIEVIKY